MSRYIDAERFDVFDAVKPEQYDTESFMAGMEVVLDAIKDAPAIEPKQGEWICEVTKSQDQATDRWVIERVVLYCSECNGEAVKMTNFCPNCGARMEGADDE